MMECPRCKVGTHVKSGKNGGRQRYLCKFCGYHYSVERRGHAKEEKEYALRMVADGMSFRQVARLLEVSQVTIMRWVRAYGEHLLQQARKQLDSLQTVITQVELDELSTFIGKKNSDGGYGYVLIVIPDASSASTWVTVAAPR
jgi:transposase-like protein